MGKVLDWNDGLRKRNSMNLYIVDFLPGFRYEFLCYVRDERKALELAFEVSSLRSLKTVIHLKNFVRNVKRQKLISVF